MMNKDQVYFESEFLQRYPEILIEKESKIFFKFGFSPNQSKVYLCLSKLGAKTASQLSHTLKIPRTETYHLLKTLQKKGCIFRIYEKPMKFEAIAIEVFLEKIIVSEKNKIKKLEATLATIKKIKSSESYFFDT